ncbi:MAG: hypothetical protein AAFV43_08565 [Planctomycetota bacterium]
MIDRHRLFAAYCLCAVLALSSGCGESVVEPVAVAPTAPAFTPIVEPTPNESAAAQDAVIAEPNATYEAPFPDRETLFDPPKQVAQSSKRRDSDEQSGGVQLLGFADLGTEKAVLSIDGAITPLASGAEHAGVRVISVAPPKVVLQRGRSRWTESIQ